MPLLRPHTYTHTYAHTRPTPQVLLKKPPVATLLDTDVFKLNDKFTSKTYRTKVNPLKAPDADRKDIEEGQAEVELLRRHLMDAAIVRVMKTRKQLAHSELQGIYVYMHMYTGGAGWLCVRCVFALCVRAVCSRCVFAVCLLCGGGVVEKGKVTAGERVKNGDVVGRDNAIAPHS